MFAASDSICIIVFIRLILLGFLESAVDKTWVEELFKREMVVFSGAVLMYSDNVFSLVGL